MLLVGAAENQSGTGGTFNLPTVANLTMPGEFGLIPMGAPYYGKAVDDPKIWYLNGTPAASVGFGIDVLYPMVCLLCRL